MCIFAIIQDNLGQEGSLTKDQVDEVLRHQKALEDEMQHKMDARRQQQLAALKTRMNDRRKKRLDSLKEKQEREKMEVCRIMRKQKTTWRDQFL